ncbi:methyl-accepting chemotaxis protein [Sapientia aquatica]|uniref:Methyl-accepting chemotaxis protein n=1 Tax=Sapientia aquatica TaxID=1549640 RepID=A0A4R5W271_9BURK|nr:methyl-accepting chemotaxis protein [Sapientia aquatica]TDK66443.1 hypothetical protein E2I14_08185 [Sapientia aquatica]
MSTELAKLNNASAQGAISPELQQFLAAPAGVRASKNVFYKNPIWALGVGVFENLRFRSKVFVISCMFLIPMLLVSWVYYSSMLDQIHFSTKERLGVEYNKEIFPVIDLAQQLRRDSVALAATGTAPSTLAEVNEKLKVAQARLSEVDKRLGAELDTSTAYAEVQSAYNKATAATGSAAFKAHSDHVAALIALLSKVTDSSNLTLDPDISSFYLMDAAFDRIPDIVENTGKLRGMGLKVLKAEAITTQEQHSLSEMIPIAEFQFAALRDGLAKASKEDPSLPAKINAAPTLEASTAFFALARKTVIDNQVYGSDSQSSYLAGANSTIQGQYELAKRLIDSLDDLLLIRINGMMSSLYWISAVIFVGIALAAYCFYSFYLVTNGGFRLISKHLKEVAEGDLRKAPDIPRGKDETADLILDLRETYDALHALIRTVRHSARALHNTSSEISAASFDLSARTEAAAAALEEQAAAMEEIGSTVGNTAEKSKLAASFAAENAKVAEDGGKVIGTVVQTMQSIDASSAKISDIISLIDGIAFQTNILALNAAVEAARAGESGRGFAVVASEVRSLAHRSADAAREIKALISNSVDQIASGTSIVEQAGITMQTMVTNAKQINLFLSDIANSANEQAAGVGQVGQSIQSLDEQTQQNAALVEETSAASGALTQQADTLQREIANFRVA